MQITLSKSDEIKLANLIKTKNDNIRAADMFLFFLENAASEITSQDLEKQKKVANASDEQAYVQWMAKRLGLDSRKPDDRYLMTRYLFKAVKKLSASPYLENPYLKNVSMTPAHLGAWKLQTDSYAPLELFVYDDVRVDPSQDYLETTHLGFFDVPFDFAAVVEKKVTWMSITPNEIETMKEALGQCHGHVVTFGLGLGYFAYMATLAPKVSSVTVVESNPTVIELFRKYLLPQFPEKGKIKIVQADAFAFAQNMTPKTFDVAFVDLWHGGEDGLFLYLKMKGIAKNFPHTAFSYWLERSLIAMLRRCVLTLMEEELAGLTDADYVASENPTDQIMNSLHKILQKTRFISYQEIHDFLSDDALKGLSGKVL